MSEPTVIVILAIAAFVAATLIGLFLGRVGDHTPPEVSWVVVYADGRRRFLDLELVHKGSVGGSLDCASRREFDTREEAAGYARGLASRSGLGYVGPFAYVDERTVE